MLTLSYIPLYETEEGFFSWKPPFQKLGNSVFFLVTGLFLSGFLSLFFIHTDISVRARGIILSSQEAECYVSTRDISKMKTGQYARIQVDAYNYKYFGMVSGIITVIENDFIIIDHIPFFKIHCRLDQNQLKLRNGCRGELKKGMSLQARFKISCQTLWQLIYDQVDGILDASI